MIVVTVNALNFVDGLDGLAAGIVGDRRRGVLRLLLPSAVEHGVTARHPATLITAVLAGVCLGFLPHNFTRPASSWATPARC